MPTYDYQCPKCEAVEEHSHSMSDQPKIKCAGCRTVMKKCLSRPNLGSKSIPTRHLGKL